MCRNLTGDNGFRWNNNPVLKEKNNTMYCMLLAFVFIEGNKFAYINPLELNGRASEVVIV